jgi:hypothetical protein
MTKSVHYYLLLAQPVQVRLFEGFRDHLFEIAENGFPVQCPSGMKETCVDQVNKMFESFFRQEPLSVVLMGIERPLQSLQSEFRHAEALSGVSVFDRLVEDTDRLGAAAWRVIKARLSGALVHLEDIDNTRIIASGLYNVWDSVEQHNHTGGTLLVEETLQARGAISKTLDGSYALHTPGAMDIIDDAVDATIESVLSMGGQVQFFEKDVLSAYQGIVLIR